MEEIKELLIKYITGSASPEDCLRVEAWLDADVAHQEEYMALELAWRDARLGGEPGLLDADLAYAMLRARLGLPDGARGQAPGRLPITDTLAAPELVTSGGAAIGTDMRGKAVVRPVGWIGRVAAVLGGIVVLGGGLFYGMRWGRGHGRLREGIADVIVVPKGQKKHVFLSDSTELWLNAGSSLRVDAGFGVRARHVFLEGEAFFKVKHDSSMVFTVETRNYVIRDIGTAFNVNTYTGDARFEAAVIEGEISVEGRFSRNHTASRIVLSHSQVLTIRKEVASMVRDSLPSPASGKRDEAGLVKNEPLVSLTQSSAIERYAGWKEDQLSFDDDSFHDIANRLERRYNVTIRIEDTGLSELHYTGSFKGLSDIRSVLDIMQETTPLVYEIKSDTVIMRRRH